MGGNKCEESRQLARMLRRLAIEKRPLACIDCELGQNCSVHGCAVMKRAAEILREPPEAVWMQAAIDCYYQKCKAENRVPTVLGLRDALAEAVIE